MMGVKGGWGSGSWGSSSVLGGLGPAIPAAGRIEDAEIKAMLGCVEHLSRLDAETAGRVVRYLADRFGYDA